MAIRVNHCIVNVINDPCSTLINIYDVVCGSLDLVAA